MDEDGIDQSKWLPKGEAILNEYRLAKPDIAIERTCNDCDGIGAIDGKRCKICKGNGRVTGPWRGNMLDPISNVRFAQASVKNLLNYLQNASLITDQHVHDGRTYQIWYEIFRATSSMDKRPMYGELRSELVAEGLSEYGFVLLIREMPATYHMQIKHLLYTTQNDHQCFLARRSAVAYRRTLDILGERIIGIKEKLKQLTEQKK